MGHTPPPPPPPPKPQSIVPAQITIVPPSHPIKIDGTYVTQHKHHNHHGHHEHHRHHGHHEHHHKHHGHHEHFLGLGNVTCDSACNQVMGFLSLQNIVLILLIVLLAYYISTQKK